MCARKIPKLMLTVLACLLAACAKPVATYGDYSVSLFDNELLRFTPDNFDADLKANADGIVRLANGRVLLKKLTIPAFDRHTAVTLTVSLKSAGDPWDKVGSVFLLPADSAVNLLTVASGEMHFPEATPSMAPYKGSTMGPDYSPALELMRFMTPFGVGYFSKTPRYKPLSVAKWQEQVIWRQDISFALSAMRKDVWIGIWADTWTAEGYAVSATLDFDESTIKNHLGTPGFATTIVNNVPYVDGISPHGMLYEREVETEFSVPEGASNLKLRYIASGHGGRRGGDEFRQQENQIKIDGEIVRAYSPWRDDCHTYRAYNPTSAYWYRSNRWSQVNRAGEDTEYEYKEILASSDLSRAGWCPGSDVPAQLIDLPSLSPGTHTLSIAIPESEKSTDKNLNFWLVSAELTGDLMSADTD